MGRKVSLEMLYGFIAVSCFTLAIFFTVVRRERVQDGKVGGSSALKFGRSELRHTNTFPQADIKGDCVEGNDCLIPNTSCQNQSGEVFICDVTSNRLRATKSGGSNERK